MEGARGLTTGRWTQSSYCEVHGVTPLSFGQAAEDRRRGARGGRCRWSCSTSTRSTSSCRDCTSHATFVRRSRLYQSRSVSSLRCSHAAAAQSGRRTAGGLPAWRVAPADANSTALVVWPLGRAVTRHADVVSSRAVCEGFGFTTRSPSCGFRRAHGAASRAPASARGGQRASDLRPAPVP